MTNAEYLLGLSVIAISVVSSIGNIYVNLRGQRNKELSETLNREKSLAEMMDGYVKRIREYEAQFVELRDRIDEQLDRISWLETILAQNGISTQPFGRRAKDARKAKPVQYEKLESDPGE